MIEPVQKALESEEINLTQMYAISKVSAEEQLSMLTAALNGEGRDKLEQSRRKRQNAKTSSVRVDRISCPLPSGRKVVITGEELTLEDAINEVAELLKNRKKANEEGLDGKVFSRICEQRAKA